MEVHKLGVHELSWGESEKWEPERLFMLLQEMFLQPKQGIELLLPNIISSAPYNSHSGFSKNEV